MGFPYCHVVLYKHTFAKKKERDFVDVPMSLMKQMWPIRPKLYISHNLFASLRNEFGQIINEDKVGDSKMGHNKPSKMPHETPFILIAYE